MSLAFIAWDCLVWLSVDSGLYMIPYGVFASAVQENWM